MQTKRDDPLGEKEIRSNIIRNTLSLVANSVVFAWVTQIVLVVSPIVIIESTNSVALGGLATALILSGDMPANLYAGKLADTVGRKRTLLIGSVIGFAGLFAMWSSRLSLEVLLFWAGIFVFALSTGFVVMNRTAITDMYPQKRGLSLGYLNTGNFIGSISAPALIAGVTGLAVLAGRNYYDVLILACLPLSVVAGLFIALIKKDTRNIAQMLGNEQTHTNNDVDHLKRIPWTSGKHGKRDLSLAFVTSSLSVGGVSIVLSLCPIILHSMGTEVGWISFSIALISVGTGGLSIIIGKLADRFGRRKTIFFGAAVMGTGLVLLPLAPSFAIICVASFLVGLGGGAIAVASTALICDIVHVMNRGKVFGANSFVINIVTFSFPPLAAILFTWPGPVSVSMLGIAIAVVVIVSTKIISSTGQTHV